MGQSKMSFRTKIINGKFLRGIKKEIKDDICIYHASGQFDGLFSYFCLAENIFLCGVCSKEDQKRCFPSGE